MTERLNEGIRRRLTLISAPAGFGKTTLLSEWMADFRFPISDFGLMPAADHAGEKPESEIVQLSAHDQVRNQKSKIRVAWVSLDEDDNDPARFWGYVITALQTPHAGMGENALASFRSPQHPPGAPASRSVTPGRRRDERAIYEQALELTVDGQERPLPVAGMALIRLGELLREWNDLEAATRRLTEGIELTQGWGEIGVLDGYIALARVKQAQGDADGAREEIQKAQRLAIKFDATELDDILVAAHQARLWIAQGDLAAAMRWVEERGLVLSKADGLDDDVGLGEWGREVGSDFFAIYYLRELEHIALARLWVAQSRPDEALASLESLLPTAERQGCMGSVIEMLALQALRFKPRATSVEP